MAEHPNTISETEVTYVIPFKTLRESVPLGELEFIEIYQCYFSRKEIFTEFIPYIKANFPSENIPESEDYKNGRLREVIRNGQSEYVFTLKGSRDGTYTRFELERGIGKEDFHNLSTKASAGSLRKRRYFYQAGTAGLTCEIDLLLNVRDKEVSPSFITIDLELPDEESLKLVLNGEHGFSFLENSVRILSLPREEQKVLRMRHFARSGINKETDAVIERLFGIPALVKFTS